MKLHALLVAFVAAIALRTAAAKEGECEVCRTVVDRVREKLTADERKDIVLIEGAIGRYCEKPANDKETKLVRARASFHAAASCCRCC